NGAPADGINRYRYPQDQTRISMLTYRCVRFKRSDHTSLPGDAPGGNRDCLFHLISDISRDLDPFFPKKIDFFHSKQGCTISKPK
ncbi:hypothetical protein, partial [Salmonella sp. 741265139_PSA]|uniref:hypothetical protein n=1 Tax=Salmonella sp. 741265139_PSA TaxID=3389057 RepID=UPI00397ED346